MIELKYSMFDGIKLWEGAKITIQDGLITSVTECPIEECDEGFLIPGLIDAHTHMTETEQAKIMLAHGITSTCDVSASRELVESSIPFEIIGSANMAMGIVINPKKFVDTAIESGAKYIKVLLFNRFSIGKKALCAIVKYAHEKGLKVAVHATEVATVKQAVEADADILLHVPMKEEFPKSLAKRIAEKGIVVAPTLVMMETFAKSERGGFKVDDFPNAIVAVKTLRECGVKILAATDANIGSFAPGVAYGETMHYEMELLINAGLTNIEVLAAATSNVAEAFDLPLIGSIACGRRANLILINGEPHKTITDTTKIQQVWVDGNPIL